MRSEVPSIEFVILIVCEWLDLAVWTFVKSVERDITPERQKAPVQETLHHNSKRSIVHLFDDVAYRTAASLNNQFFYRPLASFDEFVA